MTCDMYKNLIIRMELQSAYKKHIPGSYTQEKSIKCALIRLIEGVVRQ